MINMKLLALAGISVMVFAACSGTANNTTEASATREQAPATIIPASATAKAVLPSFRIMTTDGSTINLADLKGKKVFVNLWATWCPPCRAEIPSIEALYQKLDKEKVAVVLLSLDNKFESAQQFARKYKLQSPVYYPAESLPSLFGVDAIPATFIFDEKGELIRQNSGSEDYNTDAYLKLLN